MAKVDAAKAVELMKKMKADVRALLNTYATEASQLAVNAEDPHSPVIGCAQMALANASADYLALCGCTGPECFSITVNISGQAMQQWINAVMKAQKLTVAEVPEENTDA